MAWLNEVKPSVNTWIPPKDLGAKKFKEKERQKWVWQDKNIKDIVSKNEFGMVRKMHKSLAEMKGRWVDDRQGDEFK